MSIKHVKELFEAAMQVRGWTIRRFLGLQPSFAKSGRVTPYFACDIVQRLGQYVIDGAIGVVDEEFESVWRQMTGDTEELNVGYPIILHVANVPDANVKRFLPGPDHKAQIEDFAASVCLVLEQMPDSEQKLRVAFEQGTLAGIPIEKFATPVQREKFLALRFHLLQLSKN